jgi:hypothetical protein
MLVLDIPDFGSALLLLSALFMATGVVRAVLIVHVLGWRLAR